ncbi:hypothetical protein V6615_03370 [Oscillospiraceae bacterium PP1C4]
MASPKKPKLHPNVKITHVMADGTIRDSVEGYEVPINEYTKVAYHMIANAVLKDINKPT